MKDHLGFELQKAADRLINEILVVKVGETVTITADTKSNMDVVNATAASVYAAGGKPLVMWMATPDGVGKAADDGIPVEALTGALEKTDVWIEYNHQWLLYSTPFELAFENNKKLRYICLVEMNPDLMIRNIGEVNMSALSSFMRKFAKMNKKAKKVRVTTLAGTDVSFETNPMHIVSCDDGNAAVSGVYMMPGQINVVPEFNTIQGTIVFEGSLVPPCGKLNENISLTIENSVITKIEGGVQASEFEKWLKSFNDEGMLKMAHIAYGVNPGAKLTGNIVEDERVWGATEWGIGYVSHIDAPPVGQNAKSHCDGICLNSTVYLDGDCVLKDGKYIHPDLQDDVDVLFNKK